MCQQCGNYNNWNYQWNRCGCGCNIPYKQGEPGIQGKPGTNGINFLANSQVVTAHPGGGQIYATPTTANNVFITLIEGNSNGDSVLTTQALINNGQTFQNRSGKSVNIFPYTGATIEGIGINQPFPLPDGANLAIWCYENFTFVITEFETLPLSSANAHLAIGANWI